MIGLKKLAQRTGRPVRLTASNDNIWKAIGVTVAWPLVTAVTVVTTLADDTLVQPGEKYIEVGTVMVKVTSGPFSGYYAPFKSDAADGRQTITRGSVGLMDVTIKEQELTIMGLNLQNEHLGLLEGGYVWTPRLKVTENGAALAPSLAAVLTAFPELHLTP